LGGCLLDKIIFFEIFQEANKQTSKQANTEETLQDKLLSASGGLLVFQPAWDQDSGMFQPC
jgi:hypothetical protein